MQGGPDVILIAYHFPPDPAIGSARPYRFYKYLRKSGRRCWVVTAADPAGAPLPDVVFVMDRTQAVWAGQKSMPLSPRAHFERFIRRFLVPAGIGLVWSLDAARQCVAIIRGNPDRKFVIVSSFPPMGVHLAALVLNMRHKAPWVADFRDPMISNDPTYLNYPLANRLSAWLRRTIFNRANGMIANTDQLATQWREAMPAAAPKIHSIWNGFDPEEQPRARPIPPRPYRVLAHAGSLYGGRSPSLILESLDRLRDAHPETGDVRMVLVGSVGNSVFLDQDLCDRGATQGWLDLRNTEIPRSEAQQLVEEADYLLLLQPQSTVQVPGKLFEYISVGRPIIALVPPDSAVEGILQMAGVPFVCIYPGDDAATRDRKLLESLRLSSAPVAFSERYGALFNAEYQGRLLASVLDGAAGTA
ncbi:MAG: glycosyltransferase [Acidobacteria bacterium]|nr:glycosyltransferase [Acidobacteriota bacterium]